MPIDKSRCKDLCEFLESMRLECTMYSSQAELFEHVENEKSKAKTKVRSINDPKNFEANFPFLIHDENNDTILSRTARDINDGTLNPFEIDWMEVTLYETNYIKLLLEKIESSLLRDVAQAIDDEEERHIKEDGQYTVVGSDSYGTGQGVGRYYTYTIDNWSNDLAKISATSLAEGILDKRKKAEAYSKKLKEKKEELTSKSKRHTVEIIDDPESHLHIDFKEGVVNQSETEEINALKKERDEWKKKCEETEKIMQARTDEVDKWYNLYEGETKRAAMAYSLEEECDRLRTKCEELEREKEAEKAFNATTGATCFTSRQMGILMQAIGYLTEEKAPGKTTLGEVIEKISGYKAITVNQNMKGTFRDADKKVVAKAIESKFPKLAAKVRQI